jgi:cardiolipin synthase A/B
MPRGLATQSGRTAGIRIASMFTLLGLTACAMPPIDRYVMEAYAAPPAKMTGSRGPLTRAQTDAILERLKAGAKETNIFDRHLAVEEAITGSPFSVGNKVTLLQDGPATYRAMFAALDAARDHIHLEMYIIEDDEIGHRFADALIAKRKLGVQVSVMYDSLGSLSTPKEYFERLKEAGIDTLEFNPLNPLAAKKAGWQLNQRNHRKLLIVDGKIAFLGGINISGVYSSGSLTAGSRASGKKNGGESTKDGAPVDKRDQRPWRDTQVQVEGPVVAELQKTFVEAWQKQKHEPPATKNPFPALKPQGKEAVRVVAGWADEPISAVYVTLLSAITSAESEIQLTIAYFVPDPQLLSALKEAARRGVDVKIILPSYTDFWAVFHAGRSHYEELLQAGVKIYERQDRVLHAKTATVDGVWSTIGSTNLDWRSFVHNHELNAVVLGTEFGEQMHAMFERDLKASQAITLEQWHKRPIAHRLKEVAARVWAYWL